jgi:FkbM family methyltransferase
MPARSQPTGPINELANALAVAGRDAGVRQRIVDACLAVEDKPEHRWTQVRDDVTGPIVDALFAGAGVIRKQIASGLKFDFEYRSKIARDFVMSEPAVPDHVWEPQTTRTLLHFARGVRNVVVGGAYFGDQAIPLAHAAADNDGVVHAFEADLHQAQMLAHNAALNGLTNVRVITDALWSASGKRVSLAGDDALASPQADSQGIPTITIDDYAATAGVESIGLITLDLEGGELEALRGAHGQLAKPAGSAPVVVFEIHRNYVDWSGGLLATEVARLLTGHGYTLMAIRDFQSNRKMGGIPVELVVPETAYLDGPPHGFNVLAVKDVAFLEAPLFRIVEGVSPKLLMHRDPRLHHPTDWL